jgi:AraC-like DNA-binding protein
MPPKQLVQLLRSQVIPWTAPGARRGIIVARTVMRAADMPDGVTLSSRRINGQQVVIKNKRKHGNQRNLIAEWPQANLQEIALPKLACVVSGAADYLLSNYRVHCGPGNFILMPPHVPHQCKGPFLHGARLQNDSCVLLHAYAYRHGVLFWYSRSVNDRHINEMGDNYLIPDIAAMQLLNLLMDEAVAGKPHFEEVASGFLAAFFAVIAREIESGHYVHPGPKENVQAPARPTASFAEQVREYIENNCHKILKVDDVATHLYMSNSQFSRRMRRETGGTFLQLLTRVRIERARQMLRETDLTVIAISGYLSFKSSTHFQSLFRAQVGCTPLEYRRGARQKTDRNS